MSSGDQTQVIHSTDLVLLQTFSPWACGECRHWHLRKKGGRPIRTRWLLSQWLQCTLMKTLRRALLLETYINCARLRVCVCMCVWVNRLTHYWHPAANCFLLTVACLHHLQLCRPRHSTLPPANSCMRMFVFTLGVHVNVVSPAVLPQSWPLFPLKCLLTIYLIYTMVSVCGRGPLITTCLFKVYKKSFFHGHDSYHIMYKKVSLSVLLL